VILSITLNPSVDRSVFIEGLKVHDTNRVVRTETDAGGKGINLSRIVREMGAETRAAAFLGGGPGAFVESVLKTEGVPLSAIWVSSETRLNVSVEDGSGMPPTTFNERGPEISAVNLKAMLALCSELAPRARWACLGGSIPPGVPVSIYADLTEMFQSAGCLVVVDADGEAMKLALEAKPDLVKPNQDEAARLVGSPIDSLDQALDVAAQLGQLGVSYAMVSMGATGAVLVTENDRWIGHAPQMAARSTIGSGDSLIGGFLASLTLGRTVEESFQWGLACGSATATTSGSEIGRCPVIQDLFGQVRIERRDTFFG
jgi:1-phosphofructokinase family hexose kinase